MTVRLFKYIITVSLSLLSLIGFAQHPTVPNTTVMPFNNTYYQFNKNGYVGMGVLMLGQRADTNIAPIYPAMCVLNNDTTIYFWNLKRWSNFAPGTVTLQQLIDSLSNYVTHAELADSLGNYVNLYSPQTVLSTAPKKWQAPQTFSDSILANGVVRNFITNGNQSIFRYVDSAKNVTVNGGFLLTDKIKGFKKNILLQPLVTMLHGLSLNKVQDTLNLASSAGVSSENVILNFVKNNSSDDSINITSLDSGKYFPILRVTAKQSIDTSSYVDRNTKWNMRLPIAGLYTYPALINHTSLNEFSDVVVGSTDVDTSLTDLSINKRVGIDIKDLGRSSINVNKYAILQEGQSDSVVLNSSKIVAPNLPNVTTSYQLFYNPSTGLITYDNVPTAFNDNSNFINASYQQNNFKEMFNEMIASKKIVVKKRKHKTIIQINK